MKIKFLSASFLICFLSAATFAHEYWFEADKFALAAGEKTRVHLYVGDGIVKDREERVFQPDKTTVFSVYSAGQTVDLKPLTKEGAMPIYDFSGDRTGNYLLGMERNWSFIKIEAAKFEDYLREDGIEYIIPEREKLGERQKEGRERYSRFIKSLLQVGGKHDNIYKKRLGMKLEIVPLENPYAKKVGDELKFQVFFEGKPLAERAVFADNRSSETQKMMTDKNGKVMIKLEKSGMWLVRLVNMRRCAENCGEADWESFWAAYSFSM